MIDFVMNWYAKLSPLAFWIYWLPLIACSAYYIIKTYNDVLVDIAARESKHDMSSYHQYTTWGDMAARVFLSVTPMINCIPFLFVVCPNVVREVYKRFGQFLNFPLVPKKKVPTSA